MWNFNARESGKKHTHTKENMGGDNLNRRQMTLRAKSMANLKTRQISLSGFPCSGGVHKC